MQRGKNMAKTIKCVNVLILFLYILLVLMVFDFGSSTTPTPCLTDQDCPRKKKFSVTCRKGFCVEIRHVY